MPSPDLTPYVDLRIYDKDPQDLIHAARLQLQTRLPRWNPREGHTAVVMLEALGLEVSESVFAINRLPNSVVEILLRLYGVDRDLGTEPSVDLLFTLADNAGHTLPAGVRVVLPLPYEQVLVFSTVEPLVIPAGQTTGVVGAVAQTRTDEANGTAAGTVVELLDSIVSVETVATANVVGGGVAEETDVEWLARGVTRFSRLVETLVLPRHFMTAALERPEVTRALALDNYDPNQGGAVGAHAGHVTVAVYGDGGPLSAAQREAMRVEFDEQAQANLAVHVIDPTITAVDVSVTITLKAGYSGDAVRADVITALEDYLSPATWDWKATVYRNELIALIDGVGGVERVVDLVLPSADTPLPGNAPLATLGASTVTIQ